jgi:hypothetical protein
MKLEKQHNFSRDEAVERLRALTDYWSTKYGINTRWDDNRAIIKGKAKGISFDGAITVHDSQLTGEVKTSWLAEKIGGRAYVEGKINDYLNPGVSLEELQARLHR